MKKLLLFILLVIVLAPYSYSQLVPSSCTAPQSVMDMYHDDADRMAVRNTYRNNTTWMDSAEINPVLSDTLLKALLAVHNATSLPARDTVTLLKIHTRKDYGLNILGIYGDTALVWVKELQKGNLITGSPKVDSLISLYNIDEARYLYYAQTWQAVCITLHTSSNYNILPITEAFDTLPGVVYVFPDTYDGDGNNIQDSIHSEYVELVYSYGWTDCYVGCWYRRYWKFRVHRDCEVEYVGSYGDVLPAGILSMDDPEPEKLLVSPNPFNDHINVSGAAQGSRYMLYNSIGQKLQAGDLTDERIEVRGQLTPGSYYLNILKDGRKVASYKLISL